MKRDIWNTFKLLAVLFAAGFANLGTAQADIIDLDTTRVLLSPVRPVFAPAVEARLRQEVRDACLQAEAFWERRLIGYSSEIVNAMRVQIPKLKINVEIIDIDGIAGGILAQAGPDRIVSAIRKINPNGTDTNNTLAINATISFDLEELERLSAAGLLFDVAAHEMCHAIGFGGFILTENGLAAPVNGVGLTQYVGGKYALAAYRKEVGSPVAQFIPLQQTGAGSAGGHWPLGNPVFDRRATENRQELMLATISLDNPAEIFVTETTYALFADLGYAVIGFNDHLVVKTGTGSWPKTNGIGSTFPFGGQGIDVLTGLPLKKVSSRVALMKDGFTAGSSSANAAGATRSSGGASASADPFNLRNQGWNKSKKRKSGSYRSW